MKLAIVGGGASAFYVASRLLSRLPREKSAAIHVFDRLWAPHGLVRYGVAPDHPEVKVRPQYNSFYPEILIRARTVPINSMKWHRTRGFDFLGT